MTDSDKPKIKTIPNPNFPGFAPPPQRFGPVQIKPVTVYDYLLKDEPLVIQRSNRFFVAPQRIGNLDRCNLRQAGRLGDDQQLCVNDLLFHLWLRERCQGESKQSLEQYILQISAHMTLEVFYQRDVKYQANALAMQELPEREEEQQEGIPDIKQQMSEEDRVAYMELKELDELQPAIHVPEEHQRISHSFVGHSHLEYPWIFVPLKTFCVEAQYLGPEINDPNVLAYWCISFKGESNRSMTNG